jgi:hypothetical protein
VARKLRTSSGEGLFCLFPVPVELESVSRSRHPRDESWSGGICGSSQASKSRHVRWMRNYEFIDKPEFIRKIVTTDTFIDYWQSTGR